MHVVYCHYTVSVIVLWLFATNKDAPSPLPEERVAHFYLHDNFGQLRRPAFIIFTGRPKFKKGIQKKQ